MAKKKIDWKDEISKFARAVLALGTVCGIALAFIWNVWGEEKVEIVSIRNIEAHAEKTEPQVKKNTKDIAQLKEIAMGTHFLLKQLTTDAMEERAERESAEVKRRQ